MNHRMQFSVLLGGIAIHNPCCDPDKALGPYGTLGMIVTSDGNDRWILSCYHVLCRLNADYPANTEEPIFQPFINPVHRFEPAPVAVVSNARIDRQLDCAAARVISAIARGRILGIPTLSKPVAPRLGMRVIKSGAETGVTEGMIAKIDEDQNEIEIAPRPGSEPQPASQTDSYELSEGGDSGSIWIDADSSGPVGLHYKGSERGFAERAFAKPILSVLTKLDLQVVIE